MKRIAYIGISYPLLYDYEHQARKCQNDLSDSPNPIIESPLGLMILYDEIIFLCKSVCPNNMRDLPYVKFVDELFPDFCFSDIWKLVSGLENAFEFDIKLSYDEIKSKLNVTQWGTDIHTHELQIGDITIYANSNESNLLFDTYVFQALQERYDYNIELVTNSVYVSNTNNNNVQAEFVEKIIISEIPNYLGPDGPYHKCMDELRENDYLKDFRHWVIEKHGNMQRKEIEEMCIAVERNINNAKETIFKRYLESNNHFSFFKSSSHTILATGMGIVCTPISIADAFVGNVKKGKEYLEAKSLRWQGFVMDSRIIMGKK